MTASDRLEREKNFHDNRFGGDDSDRKSVEKYYMANIHMEERYIDIVSKLCNGKKLLDWGLKRYFKDVFTSISLKKLEQVSYENI